jgi:hypothetical protein
VIEAIDELFHRSARHAVYLRANGGGNKGFRKISPVRLGRVKHQAGLQGEDKYYSLSVLYDCSSLVILLVGGSLYGQVLPSW